MDFTDKISQLAAQVEGKVDTIETEEATKNAFVMPFLNALGYNVFDPHEVVPEFTSDYGTKKGEKVDYAVFLEGEPIMLIECKPIGGDLSTDHASQLFRYFSVTEARIGVLTNGRRYRFFSDLEEENKMDDRPFLEFDLFTAEEARVEELKKLRKGAFDLDEMLSAAHDLKYIKAMRKYLVRQWEKPEEEFVRFMVDQVYDGRITQSVRDQFTPVVRRVLHQFVSDKVSARLRSALTEEEAVNGGEAKEEPPEPKSDDGIVTTEEEMEGFHIVRAILSEVVDPKRVARRDVKTYFGILLDDNNRQPLCRLHFNTSQKYISLFDQEESEKVPIDTLEEIYQYADRLRTTPKRYLEDE